MSHVIAISSDVAITFITDNTQHIKDALSYLDQQQLSSLFTSVKKAKNDSIRQMTSSQLADEIIEFSGAVAEMIFLLELYEEKEPGRHIQASEYGISIKDPE